MATIIQRYPVIVDLATALLDAVGSRHLTAIGAPTVVDDTDIVPGETHKVFLFNGTSDGAQCAVAHDPLADFSGAVWVKPNVANVNQDFLSFGEASGQNRQEMEANTLGEVLSYVRTTADGILSQNDKTAGSTLVAATWQHLAWSFDADVGITIWKNAVVVKSPTDPYNTLSAPTSFTRFSLAVKAFSLAAAWFGGRMKDPLVASGLFSTPEVVAIMNDTTFGQGGGPAPAVPHAGSVMDGNFSNFDGGF